MRGRADKKMRRAEEKEGCIAPHHRTVPVCATASDEETNECTSCELTSNSVCSAENRGSGRGCEFAYSSRISG